MLVNQLLIAPNFYQLPRNNHQIHPLCALATIHSMLHETITHLQIKRHNIWDKNSRNILTEQYAAALDM
jgi:hypothetical protein